LAATVPCRARHPADTRPCTLPPAVGIRARHRPNRRDLHSSRRSARHRPPVPAERSAARLAHQSGGLGVPSSNLGAPTNKIKDLFLILRVSARSVAWQIAVRPLSPGPRPLAGAKRPPASGPSADWRRRRSIAKKRPAPPARRRGESEAARRLDWSLPRRGLAERVKRRDMDRCAALLETVGEFVPGYAPGHQRLKIIFAY
jgi:hypothetical protein